MKTLSFSRHLILISLVFLAACGGQVTESPAAPTLAATLPQVETPIPVTQQPLLPTPTVPVADAPTTPVIPITSTEMLPQEGIPLKATISPRCTSPAALTPALTEGPYFKAGSPELTNLAEGLPGTRLSLSGFVLTADCTPVANALIEFWQADAQGQYDNAGYTLRGHQFTDASGRYQLDTVVPGLYTGRTEHIHVKVQPPGGPELTSQLFMPDSSQNQSDRIFNAQNVINIQSTGDIIVGTYNFIVVTE